MNSPVALFCYNRAEELAQTLEALLTNPECRNSELYVFADGAKNSLDESKVNETRAVLENISGFQSIQIKFHNSNVGLAANIISGINEVLDKHDSIIVLEDDIKVSNRFLCFMNQALARYQMNPEVWHISGWNYPIDTQGLPDIFLWRVMNCWGWATWSDRWQHFARDPQRLVQTFSDEQIYRFNLDGHHDFYNQVVGNLRGKFDTWAIFWYATIFQHQGLCLNPTRTLVDNIGFGESGTNCVSEKLHQDLLASNCPTHWPVELVESDEHCRRIKLLMQTDTSVIPLDLTAYSLTENERQALTSLLASQNYSLKSSLEQIWYLMDRVWAEFGLENQQLDYQKLQEYYSHPVWLLNGLFTESDDESIRHRQVLAKWIDNAGTISKLADIGGGIGFLARTISSECPHVLIDVVEPFPADYAKRRLANHPKIRFVNAPEGHYDCITLMDVLEHVEDPMGMVLSLLDNLHHGGYLITANCFEPVIQCHLPKTFHLKYSFSAIMEQLGCEYVQRIAGTHIEIFQKCRAPDILLARQQEQLSHTIYQNVLTDKRPQAENAPLHLNALLAKFYKALEISTESKESYIVYGAGTGARALVQALPENILYLVDKDAKMWNTVQYGLEVMPPEYLQKANEKILISVFGREEVIKKYLIDTLHIDASRVISLAL